MICSALQSYTHLLRIKIPTNRHILVRSARRKMEEGNLEGGIGLNYFTLVSVFKQTHNGMRIGFGENIFAVGFYGTFADK